MLLRIFLINLPPVLMTAQSFLNEDAFVISRTILGAFPWIPEIAGV